MFEYLLVFLAQRFRRLDSSARWYSIARISTALLPLSIRLAAIGLGRALSFEQLTCLCRTN
jgi:hypothetical protein